MPEQFHLILTRQGLRDTTRIAGPFLSLELAWHFALGYLKQYQLVGCRLIDGDFARPPYANFTVHCPDGSVDLYEITTEA